jgi:putative hemolysin
MRVLVAVTCALALVLAACGGQNPAGNGSEVANPASAFCEAQGGTVELRTGEDGSQQGVCVFADGSECDEWAFYRGECQPGTADATDVPVEVFFSNKDLGDPCGEVFPVTREVGAGDQIDGALQALVARPSDAERSQGYGGWFSPETADVVRSVQVDAGTVRVDFADLRRLIPNASSSCGSAGLLAQLDATLLQFPDVDATVYAIDGSSAAFYEWLQMETPAN